MAVVDLLFAGEPSSALEDVALALALLDDRDPPVDQQKHRQADQPLDGDPNQIDPSENQKPQTTVAAFNIGQLHFIASTLGTLDIHRHIFYLLFLHNGSNSTDPVLILQP